MDAYTCLCPLTAKICGVFSDRLGHRYIFGINAMPHNDHFKTFAGLNFWKSFFVLTHMQKIDDFQRHNVE